ncbi:MAG: toxin-antitoxin system HicB family antitoxin [Peptococcaceae bacterium]|nr:toxin-antitoxin system HicB family antitoxin [Peptococcaceae bacterium]
MTATNKGRSTYRLTPEVEKWISEEAKRLGLSKNAFVQMTLAKVMQEKKVG